MKNISKQPVQRQTRKASMVGAALVCIFILAVALPSLRFWDFENGEKILWSDVIWILVIIAPLIVVIVGAACSHIITEVSGWMILLLLLAMFLSR